jgi:hypothetical protein
MCGFFLLENFIETYFFIHFSYGKIYSFVNKRRPSLPSFHFKKNPRKCQARLRQALLPPPPQLQPRPTRAGAAGSWKMIRNPSSRPSPSTPVRSVWRLPTCPSIPFSEKLPVALTRSAAHANYGSGISSSNRRPTIRCAWNVRPARWSRRRSLALGSTSIRALATR